MKSPRITLPATLALLLAPFPLSAEFQSFEGDGFDDWQATGTAFGLSPVHGRLDEMDAPFTAFADEAFAVSAHGGNDATGSLLSPDFEITQPYINFLISGGDQKGKTAVQLLIDDKVVMEVTGRRSMRFAPGQFNVSELLGKRARIRLIDEATGEWGFIAADEFSITDKPNAKFPPSTRNGLPFVEGLVSTPEIAGAVIPEGSSLTIEADHDDLQVTSPTALTFDENGNVLIAETHRFRYGVVDDRNHLYLYLDDLKSKTTADRATLHEKWKENIPLASLTQFSEVIRRLSDTDGDGKLDDSKIFSDGYNDVLDGTAAGIFAYDDAVYFACIPKLYKLSDENGDGVADSKEVIEDGFGVRISLSGHDMNGFALGPDGRIYGTIGDRGFSLTSKEGREFDYPNEGAVFRFEPDGSNFELVHTGLRNPKEIAFNEYGDAITVDNNSDQGDRARVVYIVEGGDSGWQMENQTMHSFHRQIGLENRPPNRWMNERMWELPNSDQPAYIVPPTDLLTSGPSGLTYHPGTGFLESEKGRFLVCDYKGGAANSGIWSFRVEPDGAGMKMTDARQFNWGIAATDVEYSFDGKVWITDFIEGWQSAQQGRLLSESAGENTYLPQEAAGTARIISEGFDQRSSTDLASLLSHPDSRVRLRAQIALTRKPDAVRTFTETLNSENEFARIHSIWGLGIVARRGGSPSPIGNFAALPEKTRRKAAADTLIPLLDDPDPEIRNQAVRVLAGSPLSGETLPLGKLLSDDSDRVRFSAAIAIGQLKAIGQFSAVLDFIRKNNNQDPFLRHAGIYALEHIVSSSAQLGALASDKSPAVRLAAVVALRRQASEELVRFVKDPDPAVQDEAIRAIYDKNLTSARPAVAALLEDLADRKWSPFMIRRLIHNAYRVGTLENAFRLLKVSADTALPEAERKEAVRLISNWEKPFPADQLTGHWRPLEDRPLNTLKPALESTLPDLLRSDGFLLTAALDLVEKFKINITSLDDDTLRSLVAKKSLPGEARALALTLLSERNPEDLEEILLKLSDDQQIALAITAISKLAALNPEASLPKLEEAIDNGNAEKARKFWPVLATIPGGKPAAFIADHLGKLTDSKGASPSGIELLAAAAERSEPEVKQALVDYLKATAESTDPLAKYNIALQGGDASNGASLFASHPVGQCMRCHKAEDAAHSGGGDAGPNLAGIAKRHDDRYFLESIVNPAAVVTPGYGITSITFKNGATIGGTLVAETPDHLDISTPDSVLRVNRSDIASFTPPISAMPPMAMLLKPEEIRDLVAWLGTLKTKSKSPAPRKPKLVDPSTLPGAKATSKLPNPAGPLITVATTGSTPDVTTSPPAAPAAPAAPTAPAAPAADQAKAGQQQFMICAACHGQQGEGTAAGPPLAGSEWVNGPAENLIRIQMRGLVGPIKVKGQEYNFPGGMQPMAYQNDEQIAAVLTHIRSSFGNNSPPVAASEVARYRPEVGQPQLNASELVMPEIAASGPSAADIAAPFDPKYSNLGGISGGTVRIYLTAGIFAFFCLIAVFKK